MKPSSSSKSYSVVTFVVFFLIIFLFNVVVRAEVVLAEKEYRSPDYKYFRTIETLSPSVAGKYKLKIQNGNSGPRFAKICDAYIQVETKRQCQYENLVEKNDKDQSRVENVILYLNNKKVALTVNKSVSYIEYPLQIKAGDKLTIDVIGYQSAFIKLGLESFDQPQTPPVALFSLSSLVGNAPFKVNFNGGYSYDPDTTAALQYQWDFGDGSTASGKTASHIYQNPGWQNAKLKVTDSNGLQNEFLVQIYVKPHVTPVPVSNSAPVIKMNISYPDSQNLRKVFISTLGSYDKETFIQSALIDFGDGIKVSAAEAEHTFAKDGTFLIKVTLTDSLGKKSTTVQSVSISAESQLVVYDTLFAEKTYYGSFKSQDKALETIAVLPNRLNDLYRLRIVNGDGQNHENVVCAGKFLENLACAYQNLVNTFYRNIYRVEYAHVYWNGKQITDGNDITKKVASFSTYLKAIASNKLEIRYKGYPTASIKVSIERVGVQLDFVAPVILTQLQSDSYTNQKSVSVEVQDAATVANEVFINGSLVVGNNLKSFTFDLVDGANNVEIRSQDQFGNVTAPIVISNVVYDNVAPTINSNFALSIFTNTFPKQYNLEFLANESLKSLKVSGSDASLIGDGQLGSYMWTAEAEGVAVFHLVAEDLAGNISTKDISINLILDNIAPIASIGGTDGALTNKVMYSLPFSVNEQNSAHSVVKVNGTEVLGTTAKNFDLEVNLDVEGDNVIELVSTDDAENVSNVAQRIIKRDTIAPSFLATSPAEGEIKDQIQFPISGQVSEKIVFVTANGLIVNQAPDGLSFSGTYYAQMPGPQSINFAILDEAGNITEQLVNFEIKPKILNAPLISIIPDIDGVHLNIVGSQWASRPGIKVTAREGLLSFNRASVNSNQDGSFVISLDPLTSVTVIGTDESTGETESVNLNYLPDTRLTGIIKDTDNNPLPNATVTMIGNAANVQTDGNGVFVLDHIPSGDQTIVVDGSTIPQTVTGPNRKFSFTTIKTNIGFNKQKVLDRAVYLAPLLLDGTETPIAPSVSTTVTSTHAPGVEIQVPADQAVFPDGAGAGAINLAIVQSDKTTIQVPDAAVPNTVLAMEPSGLKFKQRVPVTLPNENELPAGTDMFLISMNSSTGKWEIDGIATVSDDGSKVESKPNFGISHFSLLYAVPVKPLIMEVKNPNLAGVDVSQGSLSTGIALPSFKSLGQDVKPSLVYKSNWANPTAVVTNILDIPEMKLNITTDIVNTNRYTVESCFLGICGSAEYFKTIQWTDTYKSGYVPDKIRSQFFVGKLASNQIEYVDSTNIPTDREDIPGVRFLNSVGTQTVETAGIPNRAFISYAVPLKDQNGTYLNSGIHPTLARYEIHLKNMVMRSITIQTKVTYDGKETLSDPYTASSSSVNYVKEAMMRDISSSVLVQNKVDSEFGRGWKLAATQKIVNPENNRIMLEEADGSLSTYGINNTITPVYSGVEGVDLSKGVDLSNWPQVSTTKSDGYSVAIREYDFGSTSPSIITENVLPGSTGTIMNQGTWQCPAPTGQTGPQVWSGPTASGELGDGIIFPRHTNHFTYGHPYLVVPEVSSIVKGLDGKKYLLDLRQHSLSIIDQAGGFSKIGGQVLGVDDAFGSGAHGFSMPFAAMSQFCSNNFGVGCGAYGPISGHSCVSNFSFTNCQTRIEFLGGPIHIGPPVIRDYCDVYWNPPKRQQSVGNFGVATFDGDGIEGAMYNGRIGLNSPKTSLALHDGTLLIADFGNNRVRKLDLSNGNIITIAGDGDGAVDNGDGGPAVNAKIYHPQGLAQDAAGNIYVASERGYVRKIDGNGIISTFAGLPIEFGGALALDGPAATFALNSPTGMTIDNDNRIMYVSDTGNNRVVQINMDTMMVSVVAGSGSCDGNIGDNGPAITASLCGPTQITLDQNKNLIIVDAGHNMIRKVGIPTSTSTGLAIFKPTNRDLSNLQRNADGTWVRTYRDGSQVLFNQLGNQTASIDTVGRQTNFEYDSSQQLSAVVDPAGQRTSLIYSTGKLSEIRDPAGRSTYFQYVGQNLSAVLFPDGTTKSYEYDASGMMIREIDQNSKARQYAYNVWNRLSEVTDIDGTKVKMNDSASQTVMNNYTSGSLGPLQNSGFGQGQVADSVSDPKNQTTELAKDFQGFISKIKNAKGEVTEIHRDLNGNPTLVKYPMGNTKSFIYDATTRELLSTTDDVLQITESTTYSSKGQVLTKTDGQGAIISYNYLQNGLVSSILHSSGQKKVYTYYPNGLLSSVSAGTDNQMVTTAFEYDSKGNRTKAVASDGKAVNYVYDGAGNVVQVIKAISSDSLEVTQYQYDQMNRLVKVISPKNEITEYTYSNLGQLTTIKDPHQNVTSFAYDFKGQLVSKSEPGNITHNFTYDVNGNRQTETDPNGNVKTYSYDELNRVASVSLTDDQLNYTYNANGDLLTAANSHSLISQMVDSKGRLVSSVTSGIGVSASYPGIQLDYTYDKNDNRLELRSGVLNINYGYDNANRLVQIATSNGDLFQFAFDDVGRLAGISRPGSNSSIAYNQAGVLTSISHSNASEAIASYQFGYDLRNYPIQKRTIAGDINYGYDLNGQLISANGPNQNESFTYDSTGNRLTDLNGAYSYSPGRKLIEQDAFYTYSHDNNGNMIGKFPKALGQDKFQYLYTSLNQLKEVRVLASDNTPKRTVYYYYDPQGRRMSKKVTDHLDSSKSLERNYIYDGDNIIGEYDGNGTMLANYVHSLGSADDVLGSKITSAGVSAGLSQNPGKYFYLKDHLGSVETVTNSNGDVVQRYEYSSFGKITDIKNAAGVSIVGSPVVNTSFTFTGREYDEESGLYFYRARTYDPSIGRFLQVDPDPGSIGRPSTVSNRYAYVLNSPTILADPTGKIAQIVLYAIAAIVLGTIDNNINGGNYFTSLYKGFVVAALLWATFSIAPATNPFGIFAAEQSWITATLAVGGVAVTSGQQSGNSFNNFESNVMHGHTLMAVGFAYIGWGADKTILEGIASPDWAVKVASSILYTGATFLSYSPMIENYCRPEESNGSPQRDGSGKVMNRCSN